MYSTSDITAIAAVAQNWQKYPEAPIDISTTQYAYPVGPITD